MMARIAGMVLGVWLVVLGRPADACGFWSMADKEKGLTIGYLINSASISKGERRRAALYLDIESKQGLRVVKDRKVVFDIKGDKIRRYGKVVGTIDATGAVVFGKKKYTLELSDPMPLHDMPSWTLTVRRGDEVILTAEHASALCAGLHRDPPMTEAESQDEVRRRVIYYLAWREVGG